MIPFSSAFICFRAVKAEMKRNNCSVLYAQEGERFSHTTSYFEHVNIWYSRDISCTLKWHAHQLNIVLYYNFGERALSVKDRRIRILARRTLMVMASDLDFYCPSFLDAGSLITSIQG
jgi:hypothetical protein